MHAAPCGDPLLSPTWQVMILQQPESGNDQVALTAHLMGLRVARITCNSKRQFSSYTKHHLTFSYLRAAVLEASSLALSTAHLQHFLIMANAFRSARLLYRTVEDDDGDFVHSVESDPAVSGNSKVDLLKPASKRGATGLLHFMQETALLGVIICLQPSPTPSHPPAVESATVTTFMSSTRQTNKKPRSTERRDANPIGYISLSHELGPANPHHRNASISISLASDYQGQGYGTEAINWALDWAFEIAGLHRVAITSFAYNERACSLYERLGFTLEGRRREALWFRGRFHDMLFFSMLRHEWEERSRTESSRRSSE